MNTNKKHLSEDDFKSIYRGLLNLDRHQSGAMTKIFYKSLISNTDKKQGLMGVKSFKNFVENVQHEKVADTDNVSLCR